MRRNFRIGSIVPVAVLALIALLAPATLARASERSIELIPTLGFRGGADLSSNAPLTPPAEADPALSYGLSLNIGLTADTWLELFCERQTLEFRADPGAFGSAAFDVDVDYLQVGASYGPPRKGLRPYVSASAGLTHFGADGASVSSSTNFSGSIGGGFQVPMSERIGFRVDVRGYGTIDAASFSVACGAGCVTSFSGEGWYQFAARIGLSIRLSP